MSYNQGEMAREYVERRERGCYLIGSRVSLESIVYEFLKGESPEGVVQAFPSLSLEQVFGAILFYLANRAAIDTHLRRGEERFDDLARESREANPLLYAKLEAAKNAIAPRR
jgi:uncharacterized protein (DUF433 family)